MFGVCTILCIVAPFFGKLAVNAMGYVGSLECWLRLIKYSNPNDKELLSIEADLERHELFLTAFDYMRIPGIVAKQEAYANMKLVNLSSLIPFSQTKRKLEIINMIRKRKMYLKNKKY